MTKNIEDLKWSLEQIPSLRDGTYSDAKFENWKKKTLRTIKKLFGNESDELMDFRNIRYWYMFSNIYIDKMPKAEYEKKNLQNGLEKAGLLLTDLIEEAKNSPSVHQAPSLTPITEKKVFISHSSKDNEIGKEVVNMLQLIGVKHSQIFYTSAAGYGVPLGKDWVETLKSEVSRDGVVISLLSRHYFTSQICLLEMGATWVLSKLHVPVLIPPLTYDETNGVINTTQGFQILDRLKWSSLKRDLEKLFDLEPLDGDKWEPQRDAIISRIEKLLS
ncbi:toll/interleukin-1 receptor domain-containing protein [Algoriphagus aestuariicola]|uniref:Toll/interleukin-1 receptor domain-containing protein n=1 Tax=Algoriphagus aestuariicola TaxID=1852016 RepID=A0ABS3BJA5_9BACT|nr:toll/interleukin-1 receptor domain-containing protein [Algoriphagus aestuariicola]MBN7799238.1 toll/interleukin-1 receptor domain-containing protein [Algoriphagus aestuariicola]